MSGNNIVVRILLAPPLTSHHFLPLTPTHLHTSPHTLTSPLLQVFRHQWAASCPGTWAPPPSLHLPLPPHLTASSLHH